MSICANSCYLERGERHYDRLCQGQKLHQCPHGSVPLPPASEPQQLRETFTVASSPGVQGEMSVSPFCHPEQGRETSAALASVAPGTSLGSSKRLPRLPVQDQETGYFGAKQRELEGLELFLWKLVFGTHPVDFPTGPCCCLDCGMG